MEKLTVAYIYLPCEQSRKIEGARFWSQGNIYLIDTDKCLSYNWHKNLGNTTSFSFF